MAYTKIQGFAPDLASDTPGILQDGMNAVPTIRGMEGMPSAVNSDLPDLTATAVGAVSLVQLDGSIRTFAGTGTQIYEAGSQSWSDVTRTAGGTLTAGTTMRFAQVGNDSFASNNAAVIQKSTTGKFEDLSGAPAAAIIEGVRTQLIAFDTVDATFGDQGDRWWASADGDVDSWAPSIATGAVSGRLVDTPGRITAAKRLFDDVVVYKEQSLYLGQFVGAPEFWRFELLSDEVGAVSQEAVVPLESVHFFVGIDNFYLFDGSRASPIGEPIREFFFNDEIDPNNRNLVRAAFNREKGRIAIAYPSRNSGGKLDKVIYFHVRAGRWGIPGDLDTQTLFEFIRTTGPTYDTLGDSFATYDDLPQIPYDDPFWSSRVTKIAVFNTANKLQTLDGTPGEWKVRLWNFGTDPQMTFAHRVRPRFEVFPDNGKQINYYTQNLGASFSADDRTATLSDGKYDFEREARWHSVEQIYTGVGEILGFDIESRDEGFE